MRFSTCHLSALALMSTLIPSTLAAHPRTYLAKRSEVTAAQIQALAPSTGNCTNPPHAGECTTAKDSAPFINAAFKTYNITSNNSKAAVLSLMTYESANFTAARNYFPAPGTPGKGTRNMQSPTFNLQYAQSIKDLAPFMAKAQSAGPNGVLNLLIQYGDYDFGSGAWFLETQCNETVKSALAANTPPAFDLYMSCVGVELTDAQEMEPRTARFKAAQAALGVK